MKDILWEAALFAAIFVVLLGWLAATAALFTFAPLIGFGWVIGTAALIHLVGKLEVGPLW